MCISVYKNNMREKRKVRVNITVDKENLEKAKAKLNLFGGKISTLFDAYLSDFIKSMDKNPEGVQKEILERIQILENKVRSIEKKLNAKN